MWIQVIVEWPLQLDGSVSKENYKDINMPRAKDAPSDVGGQIDPYVQQSMQQNKQLANNRLITAIQDAGATKRTGMQEAGATSRTAMQTGTQRNIAAARIGAEDRRAAENEVARREDKKYNTFMQQEHRKFQIEQADLERQFQIAQQEEDFKRQDELIKIDEANRQFDDILRLEESKNNVNAMVSMGQGVIQKEEYEEKGRTAVDAAIEEFDKQKGVFEAIKKSSVDVFEFDNKMNLPIRGKAVTESRVAGAPMGFGAGFIRVPTGKIKPGTQVDPMGALQDEIISRDGKISVEELSSANKHKIIEKIQNEEIKTEDITSTLGVLYAFQENVGERRKGVDRKSDEFKLWQKTYIDTTLFINNLEGFIHETNKKIKGSETRTVGSLMGDVLDPIKNRSLGAQGKIYKDAKAGSTDGIMEALRVAVANPGRLEENDSYTPLVNQRIRESNTNYDSVFGLDLMGPPEEGVE